jgi:Flp pilus assembly pilin Flp
MFSSHRILESGQGLVEYALILILVSVAIIVVLSLAGKQIAEKLCDVVIQLGGTAPDSVTACRAPRITLEGIAGNETVSRYINVEAVIKNNHGLVTDYTAHSMHVDFYMGGVLVESETGWRYCLGGGTDGGPACNDYDTIGMSSGQHTLHVVATDTTTGLTGETSINFTVP